MEDIQIVLITDNNYLKYALVVIESLIDTTEEQVYINLVITEEVDSQSNSIISKINETQKHATINVISFNNSINDNVATKNHVSKAAFVKIHLPNILTEQKKVIFLDSDLLVLKDIKLLWDEFNKTDKTLSASWDPEYYFDNHVLGLEEKDQTFNSGVMLLNLEKMRKNNDVEKLSLFIREKNHLTKLNDQAAFNAVYANNWNRLDNKWNVQYSYYFEKSKKIGLKPSQLNELKRNPSIVHFTTHSKPWDFRNNHPFKKKFLSYYSEIDPNFKFKDISLVSFLKRSKEIIKLWISR